MEYKDYYNIMGVARSASQDDIKRAYRRLAKQYHPDVSKEANAEQRFKELGEAYEVLKDPQKRAAYDQLGANWKAGEPFRPPPNWDFEFGNGFGGSTDNAGGFSDFFEQLFGQQGFAQQGGFNAGFGNGFAGRQAAAKGEDHHAQISINIEDAFHGSQRSIQVHTPERDAQGRITQRLRTLNVKIPKGVTAGQQIRLSGQGAPSMSGQRGDLYLDISFAPHKLYRLEKRDIYLDLPITPWEAALGANVQIPTLSGKIDLKIPAGTQSGRKLRLKGRGLPGNPAGDFYVVTQMVTPPADSDNARQLYQQMAQSFTWNPRSHLS